MKTCTGCGKSLEESCFMLTQRRGKPYRVPKCNPCRNADQRARWGRNMASKPVQADSNPLNQRLALWFGPADRSQPLRWTT